MHNGTDPGLVTAASDERGSIAAARTADIAQLEPSRSLESLLSGAIPAGRFLDLAISITAAVRGLHESRTIHRDLNPGHIHLLDDHSVSLIGLEHSTDPIDRNNALPRIDVGAASLPYMAPELTGRMNRSIDSRSDLYSLGVIFYRMLTGVLPFTADEPLDWIYAHIARRPESPSERLPHIPPVLADLVLRLLAKNAEERYQSAVGLEADLRHAKNTLQPDGSVERFPLGREDFPTRWRVPEKLYSRSEERRALVSALDRVVSSGRSEVALVAGPAGIGKSALVRELTRESSFGNAFFVEGKADQARRDVPLATIGMAFGRLVRAILRRPEAEVAEWSRSITLAMGRNGRVLMDIVPELKWLLGEQPELPSLAPTEARNRFLTVFGDFVATVAKADHPLVIVIDDLQWIDRPSLGLIEYLSMRPDIRHVFAIGCYRSEEVGPDHAVRRGAERIRQAGTPFFEIEVSPLAADDVLRLVAEASRCAESEVTRLAEIVHTKTGGNPLFVHQFLASIAEDGLLLFDRQSRRWVADVDAITVVDVTDNVVDLMVANLRRLPTTALDNIKRLACLGHEAGLGTLASVNGDDQRAVLTALKGPLSAGLISLHDDVVRFAHDRIQEAAYSLIPDQEKPAWHLEVGRRLLASLPDGELDKWIFAVVDHLDLGAELIDNDDERRELGQLHAHAGYRARGAVAYTAARRHFARASELLPTEAWEEAYRQTLDLQLALLECEFVAGKMERAAEIFEILRLRAASELDRANVLHRWMLLHQGVGRVEDALALGLEALELLGAPLPTEADDIHETYLAEHQQVSERLAERSIADLEALPFASDPRAKAIMDVYAVVGACAYNAHQALAPLIYCRALTTAMDFGNTPSSCMTYISYGSSLVSRGDVDGALAFADLALRLNETFGDVQRRGMLLYVQGAHVNLFRRHMTSSLAYFEDGMRACEEVGDFVFANYHASAIATFTIESGKPLDEVLEITAECADFSRQTKNEPVRQWILAARQLARCVRGATSARGSLDDQHFSVTRSLEIMGKARFYTGVANLHLTRLEALVFEQRWEDALAAADECATTVNALRSGPREVTYHYFRGLVLASLYASADEERQTAIKKTLSKTLDRLAFWAKNCPQGYGHRHRLLLAEVASIEGRDMDAMQHYDEAVAAASDNGFSQNEGLASELAARFYDRCGLERNARGYRAGARAAYERWGADALVARLDDSLRAEGDAPEAEGIDTRFEDIDLASVLEASLAVSNEIVLDRLVEQLLRLALEDAGADRGFLLLGEESPQIVAEASARLQSVHVDHTHRAPGSEDLSQSVLGFVLRTAETVLIDDADGEHPYQDDAYLAQEPRPCSVLCLPLLKQAHLVGVLYLENRLTPGAFTPDRMALLEVLASQAAISLENAALFEDVQHERASIRELNETLEQRVAERTADLDRAMAEQQRILEQLERKTQALEQARDQLERLAFIDGLTGVANRRGFDDALQTEWRRAARVDNWLSLILIDLDWFKAINDRYGHARGDDCLQAVAKALSSVAHRPADLVARYGGEELVMLLPATDPAGTESLMKRVLAEIRALEIANEESPHGVLTASAGAVSLRPANYRGEISMAVERADQALYAAKAAGRNRGEHVKLG